MPKRISKSKRSKDISEWAHGIVNESTEGQLPTKTQISQFMSVMGRKGGKIGGKRRLETMSSKERSAIAFKAAQARWKKKDSNS
jgi:hypothetical protein